MNSSYYWKQFRLSLFSRSSADYWERRYRAGLDSGRGSYGALAEYKANFLNEFVCSHAIHNVIEFGCGDGHQLSLARYPCYMGLDVSSAAIELCLERFGGDPTKSFLWYDPAHAHNLNKFVSAELTLSLDVIYHLVEQDVYEKHLHDLFSVATRYVVIYSSDSNEFSRALHVKGRVFSEDVAKQYQEFKLKGSHSNPHASDTFARFFVYKRVRKQDDPDLHMDPPEDASSRE